MIDTLFAAVLAALSTDTAPADCSPVIPFVARAHDAMVSASILAAQSGSSAITVGQTLTHPGRDFKLVEQNAPKIDSLTQLGLEASIDGTAASQKMTDQQIRAKAIELLATYEKRISALRLYGSIALEYERVANSRDIELSKARRAARQSEQTTVNSYSTGSSYGSASGTAIGTTLGGTTVISGNASGVSNSASQTNTTVKKNGPNSEAVVQSFLGGAHDQATMNQVEPVLENLLQNVRDVPLTTRYMEAIWRQACPDQQPFLETPSSQ